MDFIFKSYPNSKVSETNKASENSTEAKMYVNNRGFWYKQTRKEESPFCHPFSAYFLHETISLTYLCCKSFYQLKCGMGTIKPPNCATTEQWFNCFVDNHYNSNH